MKKRISFWILSILGASALGIYSDTNYFHTLWTSLWFHSIFAVLGICLLYIVIRIVKNSGKLLAKKGRVGNLPRFQTNKIVKSGVYSCMRHPMHFGLLFFPLSIAFLLGSFTFSVIIAPMEMIIIVVLIKIVEEREAVEKFGTEYTNYKKQVPFFNIRPNCLKKLLFFDEDFE